MTQQIKKKFLLAGSIAASVLVAGAFTAKTTEGVIETEAIMPAAEEATDANADGILAFSNLEEFHEDGFNEGVWQAANSYTGGTSEVKGDFEEKTSHYSDDGADYVGDLKDYYEDNSIIISAGFQVANAITGADTDGDEIKDFGGVFTDIDGNNTEFANSNAKAFVLLDDELLGSTYTNAASISFAAEGAGYLAGQAAVVYTEYDALVNHADELGQVDSETGEAIYTPNIVMWGGNVFPTVYDYMSGFAQAITDANETYSGTTIGDSEYQDITLWSGGSSKRAKIGAANTYGAQTTQDTWFTYGFDASTGTSSGDAAKIKTDNAILNDASIVFPIAGGNTTVAEQSLVSAKNSTTKLIGVDADATLASSNDDLYIGTAAKNLETGGYFGLWAMDDSDKEDGKAIRNYEVDGASSSVEFEDSKYDDWAVYGTESAGVTLRGDITNGGVSFLYSGEDVSTGKVNDSFLEALTYVGLDEASFSSILDNSSSVEITSDDEQFAEGFDSDAVEETFTGSESNLTWLWITLGVIATLSIIGALVYFLVIKKRI